MSRNKNGSDLIIKASVEQALIAWFQVGLVINVEPSCRQIQTDPIEEEERTDTFGEQLCQYIRLRRKVRITTHLRLVEVELVGFIQEGRTDWRSVHVTVTEDSHTRRFTYVHCPYLFNPIAVTVGSPMKWLWDSDRFEWALRNRVIARH